MSQSEGDADGSRELRFDTLDIAYDERVLEPRPWTAEQSRWGAELLSGLPAGRVLELCTGAGHIGLLTAALSGRPLVAVDVDPAACAFARRNAERAGLDVEVREGPMDRVLAAEESCGRGTPDPPGVRRAETRRVPQDPQLANDGGDDGRAQAPPPERGGGFITPYAAPGTPRRRTRRPSEVRTSREAGAGPAGR